MGQPHDYMPDFVIRYTGGGERYLILETKGYDEPAEAKEAAARRRLAAANAGGSYGHWDYAMARKASEVASAKSSHAPVRAA